MSSLLAMLCAAALAAGSAGEARGDVAANVPQTQIRAVVVLVVLGDFPAELVDDVAAALRETYQVEVQRRSPIALPKSAWYAPRKRYRADALLEHLRAQVAGTPPGTRILGLTSVDISTSKGKIADWGVFGLGELGGTAAVVSGHRLWRKTKDPAKIAWRVTNTAVHEVGHVLGLDHCGEPRCVMLDAEGGIENTDDSTGGPGPSCTALLDARAPLRPRGAVVRGPSAH
ncbi:matrixin family metalloprotease [Nannocystis pusilla]|uniref:Matrixin family metalloprotease n=1 Tax=Nannocystis pusilla TaxID=889268 RepID=A0ABS7U411_9BACT|nr:matrixin family metalloprotease [Nannocystis pusilla]MBZ5715205.1 matrixin family metalloprotease [Nannocystis pusilla]